MDWSVAEQTIPTAGVTGAIESIDLRVDPGNTAVVCMTLQCDPDSYVLKFNRNGTFIAAEIKPAEAPASTPVHTSAEHHASRGKKK